MARKESIYSVDKTTGTIIRVSRTYLSAIQHADESMYVCTSVFQDLKKGDMIVNVTEILESKGN